MRTIALAAFALLATLISAPPAAAATTRYAAPGGSGVACTQVAPCSLAEAVTGANDGDTVQLTADEYTLNAQLLVTANNLTITGPNGPTAPGDFLAYILFSGVPDDTSKIGILGSGVRFQNLAISGRASGGAHLVGSNPGTSTTLDRVRIHNDGTSDALRGQNTTLINSVVRQTGAGTNGSAVTISGTIIGSTIYSVSGTALLASDSYWLDPTCSLTIRNTLAWGDAANLQMSDSPGGCTPAVDYDYSWIPAVASAPTGGGIVISGAVTPTAGVHNLPSIPVVFDPTDPSDTYLSDLVLPPNSPAINTGCTTGCSDHDYYGRPRPIGPANDIGAMEQSLAPETSTLDVTGISRTRATFTSAIDARGAATNYTFWYRRASDSTWTIADSARITADLFGFRTVSAEVEGLTPGTAYQARLATDNERGSGTIPEAEFRTSGAPPSLVVGSLKAKLTKRKAWLTSKTIVNLGGTITQKATTGSKTRCKVKRVVADSGTYRLRCTFSKRTRSELHRKSLKFKVVTALTISGGQRVAATTRVKVPRRQ